MQYNAHRTNQVCSFFYFTAELSSPVPRPSEPEPVTSSPAGDTPRTDSADADSSESHDHADLDNLTHLLTNQVWQLETGYVLLFGFNRADNFFDAQL